MLDSLRFRLLAWLLLALAGLVGLNLWITAGTVRRTADAVVDRMLVASARAIAEQTTVDQGVVDAMVPPAALEMFSTGYRDRVYYRVQGADQRLLTGYPDLPLPMSPLAALQPVYYAGTYRDQPLRLVAFAQPLVGAGRADPVQVVVGVTLNSRDAMVQDLLIGASGQQGLMLLVAGLVVAVGVTRALAPVLRLRDAVLAHDPNDLEPVAPLPVPSELRPLVDALNTYMQRVRAQMAAQRRFVANAAHQLKTPLALLSTQASVAARAADEGERGEALAALRRTTRQTARMANQMLTLSRAEAGSRRPRVDSVDLVAAVRLVLDDFTDPALARGVDLDPEVAMAGGPLRVTGDGAMLREMIVNLVDNAVRYTLPGGTVRVELDGDGRHCRLRVIDSGPGIPAEEQARVFERFYRIPGTGPEGSGLGLAIVKEVCEAAGGRVTLETSAEGGLMVEVVLPGGAAPPREAAGG
ncbi:sensor histidine kinase [Azospirillum picis]|uniref:histidine kinase n=1 Tax=Azospirillum picis TaxID=488438 RepID=A0ABU0MQU2_9PROT|nr:sensor histidine kinase [Azospirillum picis]MBP2302010.1 two-component system sensor histidine kinase TctE [Azospirillum picis]MDQ0535699.1 two-component system sensor histidine kinase TctE [Azospirillum picis]